MERGDREFCELWQLVRSDDLPPRGRLCTAVRLFWAGLLYKEQWPPDLRAQADELAHVLVQNAPIRETITMMDDATVEAHLARLRAFADNYKRSSQHQ